MREMKDSGVEWMKKIPLSWKTIRFRYLHTSSNVGDSVDKSQYSNDEEGHVFYMAGKEPITTSYESFPAWKYTNHHDLLMARNGTPYVYLPVENAVYSDHVIRVDIKKGYDRRYVRYCLQQSIEAEVVETVSIPTWSISLWDEQNIPVPPFHEQCHVADFLDSKCAEIDALSADIQSEIDTLEAYKRSVITEAVTKGLDKNAPMKDSGIEWVGEIPATWKMLRGKYIFEQKSDRGNTKSLILLSPTQNYGVIPQELYEELSGFSAVKLNEKINLNSLKTVHKGAFVISLRSFQGGFEYSEYEGVVSPAYQVFYPTISVYDGYYKYLFKTQIFIDKMNSYTMSLRDGKNIAFADFGRTYIPVPPVSEQRAIAEYLDSMCADLNEIVAQKQKQLDVLADYKKSIIYEYVTGKKEVPVA